MEIIIFSNNKKIGESFKGIEKTKEHSLSYHPARDHNKIIKDINDNSIIYFDITGLTFPAASKIIKSFSKMKNIHYGIIDQKGIIKDVADLFHNGACEYIGKDIFKEGITKKRFQNALEFLNIDPKDQNLNKKKKIDKKGYILSGSDWGKLKKGKEYTFCFMFIELDNQKKIKEKYGRDQLLEYMAAYHDSISEKVEKINGKIWMWMDFGGLILIPFDGKKCDAITASFELILNRNIISVERYAYDMLLSYRIALHIGNTKYKPRGDTGDIVSDSINSIFHLGQKLAKPSDFMMTENLFEFIPQGLEDCFKDVGEFEGREIKRMILPVH